MFARVAKWGNSLGVRVPKDLAAQAGLKDGTQVDIIAEDGRIVITATRPRYKLEDLLAGMTPDTMSDAFDWGPDKGREIVE